jgi:phospho-N-acetylmuramoyl-pentapeptide-transferase
MFFFGMVYIIETASTILQVAYYRLTKKRLFPMAPIHHTFQKFGWSEIKIDLLFNLVNLIFIFLGLYILDLLNIVEFIK